MYVRHSTKASDGAAIHFSLIFGIIKYFQLRMCWPIFLKLVCIDIFSRSFSWRGSILWFRKLNFMLISSRHFYRSPIHNSIKWILTTLSSVHICVIYIIIHIILYSPHCESEWVSDWTPHSLGQCYCTLVEPPYHSLKTSLSEDGTRKSLFLLSITK